MFCPGSNALLLLRHKTFAQHLDRFTWEPAALFLEKIRNYARRFQESSARHAGFSRTRVSL
jgi:hypothetical protein